MDDKSSRRRREKYIFLQGKKLDRNLKQNESKTKNNVFERPVVELIKEKTGEWHLRCCTKGEVHTVVGLLPFNQTREYSLVHFISCLVSGGRRQKEDELTDEGTGR